MTLSALYDCVQTRPRAEDVAELILELRGGSLAPAERRLLEKAAAGSLKRLGWQYSSMAADFFRPPSMGSTLSTAATLFQVSLPSAADCLDPEKVEAFVRALSERLHKAYGANSFRDDRLNRAERVAAGLPRNRRWYNKRWRLLRRLEDRLHRLVRAQKKYRLTRVGKSALAVEIAAADLAADADTACFVAYYAARLSARSVFTNQGQERAFDEVCASLLARCEASPAARWDVIAAVLPEARVLRHLADEQKGALLARWYEVLHEAAEMLRELWQTTRIDLATMIVRRGNDSTTWNQVASAWNKAREHWFSLLYALGAEALLEEACPGKVLRLMAGDVAYWHQAGGGGIHPDTKVWRALPPPWQVLAGEARCTREQVIRVCRAHGVSPASWIGPAADRQPVPFRPTPELVHGVAVSSPALARQLRQYGAFSGKRVRGEAPPARVLRDAHGFALEALPSEE